MENRELKDYIKSRGVYLWQVAAKLGVSDITFTKRLRFELSEKDKAKILAAAEELAKEKAEDLGR